MMICGDLRMVICDCDFIQFKKNSSNQQRHNICKMINTNSKYFFEAF